MRRGLKKKKVTKRNWAKNSRVFFFLLQLIDIILVHNIRSILYPILYASRVTGREALSFTSIQILYLPLDMLFAGMVKKHLFFYPFFHHSSPFFFLLRINAIITQYSFLSESPFFTFVIHLTNPPPFTPLLNPNFSNAILGRIPLTHTHIYLYIYIHRTTFCT